MWPTTTWLFFLVALLSIGIDQRVSACSCYFAHPQTRFCGSDFVAVVKVRKMIPVGDYQKVYKVKINRIFKSNPEAEVALKQNSLWTPLADAMCGVALNVGDTYVVGGRVVSGKASISICDLTMRWSEVTSRQRKGFRRLYQDGCACQIRFTQWWRKGADFETAAGKRCLWESTPGPQDCQEKYGLCMVGRAGCSWVPSVPYKNCIKEYQRQREQQRAREP